MPAWESLCSVPGLFMGRIGRVNITCMTPLISDENFARYLQMLASDIDARPVTQQMGVFNHSPDAVLTPDRRNAVGIVLKARADKLKHITSAYVMVTPSFIVRGALKAIWWMAPPPYPCHVTATPPEAFAYLATFLPGENCVLLSETYAALIAELDWMAHPSQKAVG